MDQYSEVFKGLGEFPGKPYHIEIKSEIKPVINAPRRVPQSLHKELEKTLNELVQLGIVSPVNKPTEWVNSLVIVEKPNGKLRICLDPRNLNKAIKREHYVIPSVDEIMSRLEGKQCFSVLDLKEGFWQVPLDKDSAELCTFNSPFGRYKFNRLPFGICSAPEVFQKKNQKLFGYIKGVEICFDDLFIAGKNKEEHDKILVEVLERAKENNIKSNSNKFQFRIEEVKYMGLLVSKDGIKADPSHVRAINEIEKPTSKNDIKRLLGMVNFLSKFIPNVSAVTSPLRVLLKKDIEFQWNHEASMKETGGDDPEMLNVVHSVSKLLPMSESRLKQFQKATEEDKELQMLFEYFKKGWPEKKVVQKTCYHTTKNFGKEWDIEIVFISPHHSQSNGIVEKAVGISKAVFKKAFEDNRIPAIGLLEYRNTPISGLGLSPAQLMFNRRLRTKLPISNKLLNPELFKDVNIKLLRRQQTQKHYYDRSSKILTELKPGDKIVVQNVKIKIWEPAVLLSKTKTSRWYKIKTLYGRVLVRNRKFLRLPKLNHKSYNDSVLDTLPDVTQVVSTPPQNVMSTDSQTSISTRSEILYVLVKKCDEIVDDISWKDFQLQFLQLKVDLRLWLHVSSEKQPCRDRYSALCLHSDIVTAVKVVGSAYKPSPPHVLRQAGTPPKSFQHRGCYQKLLKNTVLGWQTRTSLSSLILGLLGTPRRVGDDCQ
ncbi:Retrovirus-related Pol polyprotein from transposon opus [Araneus ventricosus]|uniref:Retrovirus-related Pol polyprotein from transposon opus n=1 Tax=Araneus ventricosus TaxID=182803 RepID=A0A4Y2RPG8_ARAVE|nr:Retrovirus-related Pol polyprotein from transposon opus [Araneus ventricosus]